MKRSKRNLGVTLLICLSLAVAGFLFLTWLERMMLGQYDTRMVLRCIRDIPAGMEFTEDNVEEYVELVEINYLFATADTYTLSEELLGSYAGRNIGTGEIIYRAVLTDERVLFENLKQPYEISVAAATDAFAVAGSIRKGDKVNVYVKATGRTEETYELVLENAVVHEAYNANAELIGMGDTKELATMFTFFVEAKEAAGILDKLYNGTVAVLRAEEN